MSPATTPEPAPDAEPSPTPGIGEEMQTTTQTTFARIPMMPPGDDPGFDAWLRRHLGRLHGSIIAEPVPERFLRLLEGLPDQPAR